MAGKPFSITSTGRNIMAEPSADGDMRDMGTLTVGDYYARGSRVRQGSGWQEYSVVGVVILAGLGLWLWKR
ncbi:hypothetical protein QLQ85_08855 [Halomonas sp. M4R5S39]|uniref:hypothetical protein n=1 Tax=Halomonas kalidii TaxID=3043293 RepID=UPI0024A7DD2C|nr:hypothetical protein [Halomonas kalidii]MDI5984899.1 hypothetical protein [Halomonas kalidii]